MAQEVKGTFPHAPPGWAPEGAASKAAAEGLQLGEDHWEAVRALQSYFARHAGGPPLHARELLDALEEKFHVKGGRRFLYRLFPGGPVVQGCRIAGLKAPAGATDRGFGSVM
jgi:tRNA 2-thiouridine synthesizing protein E